MELKGQDHYRVGAIALTSQALESLGVFYTPLIGARAAGLYVMLAGEAGKQDAEQTLSRLCALCGLDIDQLAGRLAVLEQYQLLRSFFMEEIDTYTYVLTPPLNADEFLHHEVFSRLYMKRVGARQFSVTCRLYLPPADDLSQWQETTSTFDRAVFENAWKADDEEMYRQVFHPEDYAGIPAEYDSEEIFRGQSYLAIPESFRTPENRRIISQMATTYSIDPATMGKLVARSIDPEKGTFDLSALRRRCLAARSPASEGAVNYDSQPVQFLCDLQGGVPVSRSDKKLLEKLQIQLKLPRPVINALVEYEFRANEGALPANLVDKIATDWVSRNLSVTTAQQAKELLEKTPRRTGPRSRVPDFPDAARDPAAGQDLDAVMRQLFGKDEDDGTTEI